MNYRRVRAEGATYFFTVVTKHRRPVFRSDENIAELRHAFRTEMARRCFYVDAIVVLPDHLHCLWTLPEGDSDFSTRWQFIKTRAGRMLKMGRGLWQPRFWEHLIRNEEDYANHVDYIHYNPVKHGLARTPGEWKHTSFHRFVKDGIYQPDWGGGDRVRAMDLNE